MEFIESIMNNLKITFTHPYAQPPKYTFGLRVALISNCNPKEWVTGKITGLRLDEYPANAWNYTVLFDYPQGFCEDFMEDDLVAIDELVSSSIT
jgi:hypothetical protein